MLQADFPATKIISELRNNNLLPAILFRTARKQCDADIERLQRSKSSILTPAERRQMEEAVEEIGRRYGMEKKVIVNHPQYPALVSTGAGAHHAGQLLMWRLLLEELMTRGLLRLMIATGTVAAGVDFPARTVVVTAHSKRGSEGFNVLTSSEFQQMSGRAGRRGKDAVGLCIIAPSVFSDARLLSEVAKRPPEPLCSSYFASPSTVLNLLKYRNVDDLRFTVGKSLAAFLDAKEAEQLRAAGRNEEAALSEKNMTKERYAKALKRVRRIGREADEMQARQVQGLERTLVGLTELGYISGSVLTEKGVWAANLCTTLVLELGESTADFIFEDVTAEELVCLIASLSGDSHRSYLSIKANPIRKEKFKSLEAVLERVRKAYYNHQTTDLKILPEAAVTVLAWIEAADWQSFAGLLRLAGVADGDGARLINQTAEHLNQLTRLEESHPELAKLAADGRRLILKPPLSDSLLAE